MGQRSGGRNFAKTNKKLFAQVVTALEVWVAAVTFLVMNGSNLQGILGIGEVEARCELRSLGAEARYDMISRIIKANACKRMQTHIAPFSSQAVLLCTLVSTLMIFIPLRVYAYVSLASLCALLIASLSYLTELSSADKHLPAMRWNPDLGSSAGLSQAMLNLNLNY